MSKQLVCFFCLLFCTAPLGAAAEQEKVFKLGCISDASKPDAKFILDIVRPVFEREGYRLEVVTGPIAWVNQQLAAGKLDGDCGRMRHIGELIGRELRPVEPFYRYATISIWGTADAKRDPSAIVRLGLPEGWQNFSESFEQFGYTSQRRYPDFAATVSAVVRGEIDAFVWFHAEIEANLPLLQSHGLVRHKDLLSMPIYVHLAPRFERLSSALGNQIEQSKQETPFPEYNPELVRTSEQPTIYFSCAVPPSYPLFSVVEAFYQEAFASLGYEFKLVSMPRMREVAEVASGRMDGTCGRTLWSPFKDAKNLIRVRTPVGETDYVLLSRKSIPPRLDRPWQGVLGYVRGNHSVDYLVPDNAKLRKTSLTNIEVGIKMLAAGRIDYLFDNQQVIAAATARMSMGQQFHEYRFEQKVYLYPFLNRRFEALSERLEEQIKLQLRRWPTGLVVNE